MQDVVDDVAALVRNSAAPTAWTLPDDAAAVGRETQPVARLGADPEDGQCHLDVLLVDVGARRAVAYHGHIVPNDGQH